MVSMQHFSPDTSITVLVEAIGQDGGCVIDNLFSPAFCAQLMSDFAPYLSDTDWGVDELGYRDDFYGVKTKRLHGLFSKSSKMESVLMHPTFIAIANSMLVESKLSNEVRLSNAELMVIGQDQSNQEFHTDGTSWRRAQQHEHPREILFSTNIALTPFTETNGATRVVPGSHLWKTFRDPAESEVCLATMTQGSVLLYSGNVIHSGGENQESEQRIGLYQGYVASWLRPLENHLITNEAVDIAAMSPDAQTILDVSPGGYTVFA